MTISIGAGKQQFALGLVWVPIQNEKQAVIETSAHRGEVSVIRKCRDKSMQVGIVTAPGADNAIVAADMVANWKPNASVIYVMSLEQDNETVLYWVVSSVSGKILQESDLLLSSLDDLSAWMNDHLYLHEFEVYAGDSLVSQILTEAGVKHEAQDLMGLSKKHGKLRISKGNNGSKWLLFGSLAALLVLSVGGWFYYKKTQDANQVVELSPAEKKAIRDKLETKEKQMIADALASDGYIAAQRYLDVTMAYPTTAVYWTVTSQLLDIPSKLAVMQWKMIPGGFMSQLESVRPHAQIIIDESQTSGQMATETIPVGQSVPQVGDARVLTPKIAVSKFLTELSQRMSVKLKQGAAAPLQTEQPPPNSGVIFTPKYYKTPFSFTGSDYAGMARTLDGLSSTHNLKPIKITMAITNSIITGWVIDSVAYTTN